MASVFDPFGIAAAPPAAPVAAPAGGTQQRHLAPSLPAARRPAKPVGGPVQRRAEAAVPKRPFEETGWRFFGRDFDNPLATANAATAARQLAPTLARVPQPYALPPLHAAGGGDGAEGERSGAASAAPTAPLGLAIPGVGAPLVTTAALMPPPVTAVVPITDVRHVALVGKPAPLPPGGRRRAELGAVPLENAGGTFGTAGEDVTFRSRYALPPRVAEPLPPLLLSDPSFSGAAAIARASPPALTSREAAGEAAMAPWRWRSRARRATSPSNPTSSGKPGLPPRGLASVSPRARER